MASRLFDVFGRAHLGDIESCPRSLQGTTIKLRTKEGSAVEVPAEAACISLRLRDAALQNGAEEEIAVPLKQQLLKKVIEYLEYHKDTPASKIVAPLEGDGLAEFGAQKWDVAYVNVDKDTVFDLTLAASFLDIPGLLVLTSAKLVTLVKDKGASKLQKDFSYIDDASADETESLQGEFAKSRRRLGFGMKDEGEAFAQSVVMMNGVLSAARQSGVLEGSDDVSLKSWHRASWRTAVLENWGVLALAPEDVASDRSLVKAAIAASHGAALAHASGSLKADRELVLEAVSYNGAAFKHAAETLRGDRSVVLEAIRLEGTALASSTRELREDRAVVLEAAQMGCGSALEGAVPALRSDRELVVEATLLDPAAFKYAGEDLRNDYTFALSIAGLCGAALQYMPEKFRADAAIVQKAIASNPSAVMFAHTSRRVDLEQRMPWDSNLEYMEMSTVDDDTKNAPPLRALPETYWPFQLSKIVFMSGMGTIQVNIGQGNYLAANSVLDRMNYRARPTIECSTLMWGGMGQIGMRLKAFGSQDILNQAPENLLTIDMARSILQMVCTVFDVPDWVGGASMDLQSREYFLTQTAGFGSGGGWKPAEDAGIPGPLRQHLKHADPGKRATAGDAPLGGWPTLLGKPDAPPGAGSGPDGPHLPIIKGCRVSLSGLSKKKEGVTGIAVKQLQDGKWKVMMDDSSGYALLKEDYLRGVASPGDAAAGIGVHAAGSIQENVTVELEAQQVARDQKKKLMEEKAALAKERLAEVNAEKRKHEGIPGVFRAVRPGWNDHAIELTAGALHKIGADTVPALRSMLEPSESGEPEVNRLLAASGERTFPESFLREIREQCERALGG